MMMKKSFLKGMAAVAMGLAVVGCSHESDGIMPTHQDTMTNAAEKLGVEIDPNQDWNMTSTASAAITVNGDYGETYTVTIFANDPLVDRVGNLLASGEVANGGTFLKEFEYASAESTLVVGISDHNGYTTYRRIPVINGKMEATIGEAQMGTRSTNRSLSAPSVPDITIPDDDYAKSFLEGASEPTDENTTDNYDNGYYVAGTEAHYEVTPGSITTMPTLPGFNFMVNPNWNSFQDKPDDLEFWNNTIVPLNQAYERITLENDYTNKPQEYISTHNSKIDAYYDIVKALGTSRSHWINTYTQPVYGVYTPESRTYVEATEGYWVPDPNFVTKFKITGEYTNKGINVLSTEEDAAKNTKARSVYISGKWTVAGPYNSSEQRVGGGAVIVVDNGGELNIPKGITMTFVNEARLVVMPGGKVTGDGKIEVTNGNAEGKEGFNGGTINITTFNNNMGKFYNYGTFQCTNLQGGAGLSNFYNHGIAHIVQSGEAAADSEGWSGNYNTPNTRIYNACQWYCEKDMRAYVVENTEGSYFYVGGELMMSDGTDGTATNSYVALAKGSLMRLGSLWNVGTTWQGPENGYAVVEVGKLRYFTWDSDGPITKGYFANNIAVTVDNKTNTCQGKSVEIAYDVFTKYVANGLGTNGNTTPVGNNGVVTVAKGGANVIIPRDTDFEAGVKGCTPGYNGVPSSVDPDPTPTPTPNPDPETPTPTTREDRPAIWSYAFEDTPLGDYDMNDVVLKVSYAYDEEEGKVDYDHLEVTLCCTGATLELKAYLGETALFGGEEVHKVLGNVAPNMLNTGAGPTVTPVTVTINTPTDFQFGTADFWIDSPLVPGGVHIAKQGQDPHGVVIPGDWAWPTEYTCIKVAYPNFVEFAKDASTTSEAVKGWYKKTSTNPVAGKTFKQ